MQAKIKTNFCKKRTPWLKVRFFGVFKGIKGSGTVSGTSVSGTSVAGALVAGTTGSSTTGSSTTASGTSVAATVVAGASVAGTVRPYGWRGFARPYIYMAAILVIAGVFATSTALASGPSSNRILNYQIRLTDSNGIAVANGANNLKLTFYTLASGGSQLYTICSDNGTATGTPTAVQATFTSGTSTVLIGDTAGITCASGSAVAIPASLFDNTAMYLGVTVAADSEMTPRKRIVAAGYALNADKLDDLDTSAAGGTSAFVPVTDSNGNLVLTGTPQSTGVSGGSVYINPASATANYKLFGVALGGSERFSIDEDGDVVIAADLTVDGGATFGDSSDSITFNTSTWTIAEDLAVTLSGGVDGINFDSNTLSIDADNDSIGIGTATPSAILDITPPATSGATGVDSGWFQVDSQTYTDNVTTASTTTPLFAFSGFQTPTLNATNSSVTTTAAATVYIEAAPVATGNMTITNPYALWVDAGEVRLDGETYINDDLIVSDSVVAGDEITITSADPALNFEDTDATAGDTNASISVSCTDTGDGTEDCDVTFMQQIAGAPTDWLIADADGSIQFQRTVVPTATDGAALGTSSVMWSDLFLASGSVINFNNSDVTMTHSANTLTIAGGSLASIVALADTSTAVTQAPGDNTTKVATTAYVDAGVATVDTWAEVLALGNTSGGTDVIVSNGDGIVVGHTALLALADGTSETQILGTTVDDSTLTIGMWSTNNALQPKLKFMKSGHATIAAGNNTTVADNELVGSIEFYPADGTDLATLAAAFNAEVDDATPAAGDVGMAFTWDLMAGGAGGMSEVMRLSAAGALLPGSNDAQDLGSDTLRWKDIYLGPGSIHIGTSTSAEGTINYNDTTQDVFEFSTDGAGNADIAFFTDDLYLDKSAGRVGIGTAAPSALLDVVEDQNATTEIRIQNTTADTLANPRLRLVGGSDQGVSFSIYSASYTTFTEYASATVIDANAVAGDHNLFFTAADPSGDIGFYTAGRAAANRRMTIDSSGNVGIGDTTPAALFTVGDGDDFQVDTTGDVSTTGTLSVDGTMTLGTRTTLTDDGTTFTILPAAGDYVRIGNAGTEGHLTPTNDDLFVSGALEVDGATYFDSSLTIAGGDVLIGDGDGLGVGHTALLAFADTTSEVQVMGTAAADSAVAVGLWSVTDALEPTFRFMKSGHASIGATNNTTVADNEILGSIQFYPADGTDLATLAASFGAEVDDGTPAAGDIGTAFVWQQMPGGAGAFAETMRLSAAGALLPGSNDAQDLGSDTLRWQDIYLGPSTLHIGSSGDESAITYTTASDLLTFQNSADSATGFQFLDADGGTPILNIDTDNERVGIGTAAPPEQLTIADTGNLLLEGGYLTTPFGGLGRYGNLITYSEMMDNAAWTKTGGVTVTANNTAAPDGQTTADKLNDDVTGGGTIEQTVTIAAAASTPYTFSVWLKDNDTTGNVSIEIEDLNGTGPSSTSTTIDPGSTWKRYSVTHTPPSDTTSIKVVVNHDSTASNSFYAWGAQLQKASSPGVYTQVAGTAVSGNRGLLSRDFRVDSTGEVTINNDLIVSESVSAADLEIEAAEDTEFIQFTDSTNSDSVGFYTGTGTPNGTLSAQAGSLFMDQTGVLYVNTDGSTAWSTLFTSATGANIALSNLASVAINTSLLPASNDSIDLGDNTHRWKDIYLGPGSIHIGTSTSAEGTINYNDTTQDVFEFSTDSSGNADIAFFTDDLYLDKSTGNVGIGTASPSDRLYVRHDQNASSKIIIRNETAGTAARGMFAAQSDTASGSFVVTSGSFTAALLVKPDQVAVTSNSDASNGLLLQTTAAAPMDFGTAGTLAMTIESDQDIAMDTDTLFVDASENMVGINDTTPSSVLDITNTGAADGIYLRAGAATYSPEFRLYNSSNVTKGRFCLAEANGNCMSTTVVGDLTLGAAENLLFGAGGTSTEKMRINSSGYVGIGTATPSALLDVTPSATSGATGVDAGWFQVDSQTYTDNATAASGTAALFAFSGFQTPTLAAQNTGVTTTDAATVYIEAQPTAAGNMTITNPYALWVDSGNSRFDGHILPGADDTYDLGSDSLRWRDIYLGPSTLHIGSSGDESAITYTTASDLLTFQNSADSATGFQFLDADGGTPILNIDTDNERVGIGTDTPLELAHIYANASGAAATLLVENDDSAGQAVLRLDSGAQARARKIELAYGGSVQWYAGGLYRGGGSIQTFSIGSTDSETAAEFSVNTNRVNIRTGYLMLSDGAYISSSALVGHPRLYFDDTDSELLIYAADLALYSDTKKLLLGGAYDAELYFDGSNLIIDPDAVTAAAKVYIGVTADDELIAGKVGIGNVTPSTELHVVGTSRIESTDTNNTMDYLDISHDVDDATFSTARGGYSFEVTAQKAQGTMTLTGQPIAAETFVVNLTTFTAVASGATGDQFNIGGTVAETVTNIAAVLNSGSESANLTAWAATATTVVIEWDTAGTAGNAIVFTEALSNATVDGGGTLGGTHAGVAAGSMLTLNADNANTAAGYLALGSNTTGIRNNAIGASALYSNTEGSYNTALGYQAGLANTTGNSNIAVGRDALRYNTTGDQNIALGYQVGYGDSAGASDVSDNVFIGFRAGYAILTGGDDNVFIGYQAGNSVTTGNTNILIGYDVDTPTATTNSHLNIGDAIFGNLSTGNVGVGTGEGGTTAATGNTFRAPDIITGGAGNVAGADLTIAGGLGTGTGDVGQIIFRTPRVAAAGDNLQSLTTVLTLDGAVITLDGETYINDDLIISDSLEVGDQITITSADPALNFEDTDATAGDTNASISVSCTDTGDGTEDCDVTFMQQVAGAPTNYLTVDADGNIALIPGTSVSLNGRTTLTDDGTTFTILPAAGDYTRIGDTGTHNRLGTPTNDDLFVAGNLEVDHDVYFDNNLVQQGNKLIYATTASGVLMLDNAAQTPNAMMFALGTNSRSFLIVEYADRNVDFAHAVQTNPTVFLQSADATDVNDWLSLAHDQSNAVIGTGRGGVSLTPVTLTSGGTADFGTSVAQTLNDTGAAGGSDLYTGILLDLTTTDVTGWDTVNLMDLQDDSSSIFKVSQAGVVTLNSRGTITDDGTTFTILPAAGDYVRIGDAGTHNRLGTPTNDDLFVAGKLEVDGVSYFDSSVIVDAGLRMNDQKSITFGNSDDVSMYYNTAQTPATITLGLSSQSNSIIIAEKTDVSTDFGHAQSTNPTIFLHSADATDTADWLSLAHDQSNAVIGTGRGGVSLTPVTLTSGGTADFGTSVAQTLNDTGAAGGSDLYTGILLDLTTTDVTGWDTVNLMDLQDDSSSIFKVSQAGVVTLNSRSTITDDGTTFTILPDTGDYVRIGDAGTTSHTLNNNDDLLVAGMLEVNNQSYFDNDLRLADNVDIFFGTGSDVQMAWSGSQTPDAFAIGLGSQSNSLLVIERADWATDFAHALATNPTVFIQSADGNNTKSYLGLWHDDDDATFTVGRGGYSFETVAQHAQGTMTLTGQPIAAETFVVNLTTFTAVASGATGNQFNIGGTVAETVTNIAAVLNSGSESANLTAWDGTGDTVVIEWDTAGTGGNSKTFTEALSNATADGSGTLGGTHAGIAAGPMMSLNADNANTAAGYLALGSNTTGNYNVAMGNSALYSNTTGNYNLAMGYQTLYTNSTGSDNTAVGSSALRLNTIASYNLAVGRGALATNTEGSSNMALGYQALAGNIDGGSNNALGVQSLRYNTTGDYNVAVGYRAGYGVLGSSDVSGNVFIGYKAGNVVLTGADSNVMIGYQAGNSVTTGNTNILIGYDVDTPTATTNSHLNIGNTIYADLSTDFVAIGKDTPLAALDVEGEIWAGATGNTNYLRLRHDGTHGRIESQGGSIYLDDTPILATGFLYLEETNGYIRDNINSSNLSIQPRDSGGTYQYGIHIDSSGKVGIAAANASATLDITPPATSGATGVDAGWFQVDSQTYTDNATAASGTAALFAFSGFQTPTLAAQNTGVTTTDAATVYIEAQPTAGANMTITNPYALWVDSGNSRFDGQILAGNGSVGAPAYSFLSETNAGIYWSSTQINFVQAGVLVAYFDRVASSATRFAVQQYSTGATADTYPAHTFANDTDTGLTLYGTDQLSLTTGGTTKVLVDSSGNVGIGVVTPSATLDITPPATSGATGVDAGWFQVDSQTYTDNATAASGTATLFAFSGFQTPTLAAQNTGVTTTDAATVYIEAQPTAGANMTITNPYALWVDSGNSRFDGHILPGADDTYDLGSDSLRWRDIYLGPSTLHIGSSGDESAITYTTASDLLTFQNSADSATGFQFLDADGGTPILNIDTDSEFVGIGTAAPGYKLDILGSVRIDDADTYKLYFTNNSDTNTNYIFKVGTNTMGTDARWQMGSGSVVAPGWSFTADTDTGVFRPAGNQIGFVVNAGEVVRIDSSGNVGIGTTTPSTKLHVVGTSRIESTDTNNTMDYLDISHDVDDATFSTARGGYSFEVTAQKAQGTMTLTDIPVADETFVINATTITAKADGSGNVDWFTIGGTAAATVTNIVATLAECTEAANLTAWAATATTVVIEWDTAGTAGNAIVFTEALTNASVDGSDVLGGTHAGVAAGSMLTIDEDSPYNSAVGYLALQNNTTGAYNSAVGYLALGSNTTGDYSSALGLGALAANTEGYNNSALGAMALYSSTTGYDNTAVGMFAMAYGTGIDGNTAVGKDALLYNTTGDYNVAVGVNAGKGATGASDIQHNVFIGANAGLAVLTGADDNVMIGFEAGDATTTGNDNVFIGYQAGDATTTGASNILIGSGVDASAVGANSELNIGNTIYADLSTDYVGIGTAAAAPNNFLQVEDLINFDDANTSTYIGKDAGNASGADTDENTAVGYNALSSNTSGDYNTAIGTYALFGVSSGGSNTAVGYKALRYSTGTGNSALGDNAAGFSAAGNANSAFGYQALYRNETGDNNTALGYQAGIGVWEASDISDNVFIGYQAGLAVLTGADYNTFVGSLAGTDNTTGNRNSAVGYEALSGNTTGNYNSAVGGYALYLNDEGDGNTAMGYAALYSNNTTAGDYNTAMGYGALNKNTAGYRNSAVGYEALLYNTTGAGNIAMGYRAGYGASTLSNVSDNVFMGREAGFAIRTGGDDNVMIGHEAGKATTTGNDNVMIGKQAGDATTTGDSNILIGSGVDAPAAGDNLKLNIGNTIYGDLNTDFVGIGKVPGQELEVQGDIRLDLNGAETTIALCHSAADKVDEDIVDCSGAPSDLAEWYETTGAEEPGDIVKFTGEAFTYEEELFDPMTGQNTGEVAVYTVMKVAKTEAAYDESVFGVISTSPLQVLGESVKEAGLHPRPVALIGRVPAKVNMEGGAIKPGDAITSSSVPGVGMKAEGPGRVIGYALDFYSGDSVPATTVAATDVAATDVGIIQVFIQPGGYHMGSAVEGGASEMAESVTQLVGTVSMDLDVAGYKIKTSGGVYGINDIWSIDWEGNFSTGQTYATVIPTDTGDVTVYSQQSPDVEITFSGIGQLAGGEVRVEFAQDVRNIISGGTPLKVNVTLTSEANGVYVTDKSVRGFVVREVGDGVSDATFDWFVVARRKGYDDPADAEGTGVPPDGGEPVVDSVPAEGAASLEGSDPVADASGVPSNDGDPVDEPVVDEPPADDPVPAEGAASSEGSDTFLEGSDPVADASGVPSNDGDLEEAVDEPPVPDPVVDDVVDEPAVEADGGEIPQSGLGELIEEPPAEGGGEPVVDEPSVDEEPVVVPPSGLGGLIE